MNNTIHSSDDFEGMRKAGNLAASTLDLLVEKVKPGVSTEELDNIAFDYIAVSYTHLTLPTTSPV